MRRVEQWSQHSEGSWVRLVRFISVCIKYLRKTPKGRCMSHRLDEFIRQGIAEFMSDSDDCVFQTIDNEHFILLAACPQVYRQIVRVVDRNYRTIIRRGADVSLDALGADVPEKFDDPNEGRKLADKLLAYIDRLPAELADVVRAVLKAYAMCPDGSPATFVKSELGMKSTTYYVRLEKALQRLREMLEADGWHFRDRKGSE